MQDLLSKRVKLGLAVTRDGLPVQVVLNNNKGKPNQDHKGGGLKLDASVNGHVKMQFDHKV